VCSRERASVGFDPETPVMPMSNYSISAGFLPWQSFDAFSDFISC